MGMECVGAPVSWLYGALFSNKLEHSYDNNRRLNGSNFSRAKEIIDLANAKEVYIYAMGFEPWLNYILATEYEEESYAIQEAKSLIDYCNRQGIKCQILSNKYEIQITR